MLCSEPDNVSRTTAESPNRHSRGEGRADDEEEELTPTEQLLDATLK